MFRSIFLIAAWVTALGASTLSAQPNRNPPTSRLISQFNELKDKVQKTIAEHNISDRREYFGTLKDYRLKLNRMSPRLTDQLERIKTEIAARQKNLASNETKARRIIGDEHIENLTSQQDLENLTADQLKKIIDDAMDERRARLDTLNQEVSELSRKRSEKRKAIAAATDEAEKNSLRREYTALSNSYFRVVSDRRNLSRRIRDLKSLPNLKTEIEKDKAATPKQEAKYATFKTASEDLGYLRIVLDDRVQSLLSEDDRKSYYTTISTGIFAVLVGVVIFGFFAIAFISEPVRRAIFAGDSGIQFVTMFSLVIAIILFGILGILEGKELAALLGGLSGYILGRGSTTGASRREGSNRTSDQSAQEATP
jgi:hypothetical protein